MSEFTVFSRQRVKRDMREQAGSQRRLRLSGVSSGRPSPVQCSTDCRLSPEARCGLRAGGSAWSSYWDNSSRSAVSRGHFSTSPSLTWPRLLLVSRNACTSLQRYEQTRAESKRQDDLEDAAVDHDRCRIAIKSSSKTSEKRREHQWEERERDGHDLQQNVSLKVPL